MVVERLHHRRIQLRLRRCLAEGYRAEDDLPIERAGYHSPDPKGGKASSRNDEVVGRGSLEDCADIVGALPVEERSSLRIGVNDMELHYGSEEIGELLIYLSDESAGSSNKEISEIEDSDR